MTAEDVIAKLRIYIKAADAWSLNQARLGTEWPVSQEAKDAVDPLQKAMAQAWRDLEMTLRNYDFDRK